MTVCCEHNPCPDRPTWFLSRFQERPWRCPQCGRFWITVDEVYTGMGPLEVPWRWQQIEPKPITQEKP